MNSHALQVLEYDRVREILSSYAASALGKTLIETLEPLDSIETIKVRLDEVEEMRSLLAVARIPLSRFRDVARSVRHLADGGRPAEPELLYQVLELLRGAHTLKETLTREPENFPALHRVGMGIENLAGLREIIEKSIDPRTGVRDDATEKLDRLRREIRLARESIRERITRKLGDRKLQKAIQKEGIKFKNDRYLLPVKAEYRSWVHGVIRDRSHTGSTLYMEPEELVLEGDRLLEIIDDERNEERRILWELTREVLAVEKNIQGIQDRIAEIDLAYAKAKYAESFGLIRPQITDPSSSEGFDLELMDARHPFLMWLSRDSKRDIFDIDLQDVEDQVVPLNVRLGKTSRLLIVTGPNTGGKTVALKTIGLNILMAVSGIPIPATAGSRVPLVSNLFADIGDEQSIEQNLSTFSSHLKQVFEILGDGNPSSLVLLDELGAGTDPLEGAALATALLNWFHRNNWHGVISTHLGSLKEFAFLNEGAENAAMQFDQVSLKPTFKMVTGLPGTSHALEIARRIGVPNEILDEAQKKVDEVQGPTQEVIEKMVDSHHRMEKERRRMERLRQRAQGERRAAESEREEARVEREIWRKEAEILVDDVIRSARGKLVSLLQKLQGVPKPLLPVVDDLNWTVKLLLQDTPMGERREAFARSLKKEDEVYIPKFRERCKVRKINKGDRLVTVLLNGIPTEVGFDDISWLENER